MLCVGKRAEIAQGYRKHFDRRNERNIAFNAPVNSFFSLSTKDEPGKVGKKILCVIELDRDFLFFSSLSKGKKRLKVNPAVYDF